MQFDRLTRNWRWQADFLHMLDQGYLPSMDRDIKWSGVMSKFKFAKEGCIPNQVNFIYTYSLRPKVAFHASLSVLVPYKMFDF